ncbi:hypothetical protein BaRGS_00028382 [Batillaria attramentaria]|uniref:Uncharacterized protein n=1 Tax=Batillaria attramentaria TaxID=370345 RepID=A0ABD0JYW8_9CAEN
MRARDIYMVCDLRARCSCRLVSKHPEGRCDLAHCLRTDREREGGKKERKKAENPILLAVDTGGECSGWKRQRLPARKDLRNLTGIAIISVTTANCWELVPATKKHSKTPANRTPFRFVQ